MRHRWLTLTGRDVSASGLKRWFGVEAPVADATGKDLSASGLKVFSPEGGIRTAGVVRPRMRRMLRISARRAAHAFKVGFAV